MPASDVDVDDEAGSGLLPVRSEVSCQQAISQSQSHH